MDVESRKSEIGKIIEKYQSNDWMDAYKSIADELNGCKEFVPSEIDNIESELNARKTETEVQNIYFGGKYGR